jgi:tRNA (uracil-5-)-methyltransferase TRM9
MNVETVGALNRITRRFYDASALGFAVTHEAPRPGWERVLNALAIRDAPELSVLDIGCGNGRLARFIQRHAQRPFRYLGVDASPALVNFARAETGGIAGAACAVLDFVEHPLETLIADRTFTLIVAFGVLHHIPAHRGRREFLEQLCCRVAPGGALACSIWRAQCPEQGGQQALSWEEYNRGAGEPVELAQLERGDNLVARRSSVARYCHFVDDDETARLFDALPLAPLATFTADGPSGTLNSYVLLRRSA